MRIDRQIAQARRQVYDVSAGAGLAIERELTWINVGCLLPCPDAVPSRGGFDA